ncbi:uncharacterized protein BCR38DRAFT_443046 [Pseudomassariella vexata]|uniref:FAD-binding domain-containing protein n=1 Tax=Pseudomassariella vexata TaxID=1141098 RepID=A0A1Y2DP87_9PEZI|nr:uncharacterized protein BCR38DRAFT_443046 [Pseudomassariella vexata]ORY60964.1 hypothetical protein BCR38DRAFT_443046 [Pseudomassariella vexata]
MEILIVGAGIAGLSTSIALSHALKNVASCQPLKIIVLESASALAEIGAGVQMTPQAIKNFFAWGMKDDLLSSSAIPTSMNVRHGPSGDIIGKIPIGDLEQDYQAPYLVVHRAVLHSILHSHALKAGVEVRTNSRVTEYGFETATVTLADGTTRTADLIIAADGINSLARKQFLGPDDPGALPTGWAAFRMICSADAIKADASVAPLLEGYGSNLWIDHNVSCMTYLIKDSTMLNIVLSHRDDVETQDWTPEYHKTYVDGLFKEFDPRVKKLIDMAVPKIVNYPVYAVPPLKKWIHDSGRFVLLGDATHAMAFYLSMGVSLAVDDAASLGEALRLALSEPDVVQTKEGKYARMKKALHVFEQVRIPRASSIQAASLHAGGILHMPPGPDRELRDEGLRHCDQYWPVEPACEDERRDFERVRSCMYGIADKRTRDWCYGYDSADAIRGVWRSQ